MTKKHWTSRLSHTVNRICLWAFLGGFALNVVNHPHHSFYPSDPGNVLSDIKGGTGIWLGALAFFCLYWLIAFWVGMVLISSRLGRNAAVPCPTPQEIELEMRRHGYNPTFEDVMAVHRAKKREQAENVGIAVAWFAGLQWMGHEANKNKMKLG